MAKIIFSGKEFNIVTLGKRNISSSNVTFNGIFRYMLVPVYHRFRYKRNVVLKGCHLTCVKNV